MIDRMSQAGMDNKMQPNSSINASIRKVFLFNPAYYKNMMNIGPLSVVKSHFPLIMRKIIKQEFVPGHPGPARRKKGTCHFLFS